MKTKLMVLSIAGIVILLLLYLFLRSLPEDYKSGKKISLRSDIKSGYTMDDMLNNIRRTDRKVTARSGNGNIASEIEEGYTNAQELERIQALIRENEQAVSGAASLSNAEAIQPTASPLPIRDREETADSTVHESATEIEAIEPEEQPRRRGFNSISLVKEDRTNAVKAFVHSTQTVMVGSTLKMQLAENCLTDDGQRIRKGTPVYGEVTNIDGERVIVKITTVNIGNNILPFKKNVYSKDALEGIYVPGNPKSEAAQEAGSAAIQGAQGNITGGMNIGTQLVAGAANSVISATKSATTRNIRRIKVTIKTNYQLLLMDDKK